MVGIDHIVLRIGGVLAARTYSAQRLRAEDQAGGIALVEGIWKLQVLIDHSRKASLHKQSTQIPRTF
jgi:hypothetical protein